MHGDHFYEKGDFGNAVKHYSKTIKHIQPS
jgi:hypothetical protein